MNDAPDLDIDAQEGLLGCALLGAAEDIRGSGIDANSFSEPRCRFTWIEIEKLLDAKTDPNVVSLHHANKDLEPLWLVGLSDKAPTVHNWTYWLPRVKDVAARYQVWSLCNQVAGNAKMGCPSDELLASLESGLLKVGNASSDVKDSSKAGLKDLCDWLDKAGNQEVVGIKTGIGRIDKLIRGLKKATMNTLAARPATGKSALAANVALKVAKEGGKVLVFTAEMAAREYQARLLAIDSKVDVQNYLENGWQQDQKALFVAMNRLKELPIYIVDDPSITAPQMRAYSRKVARKGLDLVIVDYLQLYRSGRKTRGREEEVSEVSKAMKQMAMECDVPVVVLSQMNRGIESRDSAPRLSDLRESGSIEQDSDTVAFLWNNSDDVLMYCLEKNRNGGTGQAPVNFIKHNQVFEDLSGMEGNAGV